MTALSDNVKASTDSSCTDSSAFLNWSEEHVLKSEQEKANVFQSLVATMKVLPALDGNLEVKAMKILESMKPKNQASADAFLSSFSSSSDDSSTNFIQSIVVLISSPNMTITTAAMKMLDALITFCSGQVQLNLVKADLISQIIITLNPQSLSLIEAEDIHINLTRIIWLSLWPATPAGLAQLRSKDENEQQAVHETGMNLSRRG
ncbi:hypothetical protein BLNAU_10746 [Blattamonas nauphoetae]|uniref:Uncharacterized protein n=1 Tax=Blattamonas nauphoetae TaxID=2049346 RepID=A0ABQ9XP98_9EUKA|nr:hypothetical protein BLNAU_10746 [Blattamonas nauphoetae]